MKIIKLLCLSLLMLEYGCGHTSVNKVDSKTVYTAINKNDTATFKIKQIDKSFYGQLEINYRGAYKDSGGVTGVIIGDTLKGTYRFKHYGIEKWHFKPIALLKKNNQLIMGEGLMEIYMGMYYFKKNSPINYQKPKFIFEKRPSSR